MKKTALVIATLAILVGATFWVSRATRSAGAPLPANIEDLQGKPIDLHRYDGKVVLVNYWATWCSPCLFEIPWLIEFQKKYGDRGFTVLGVATDDERDAVVSFVANERFDVNAQKEAINYPILIGNEAASNQFGGLIGLPTSFVIGRDGKVSKRITGLISYDEIAKAIESLL